LIKENVTVFNARRRQVRVVKQRFAGLDSVFGPTFFVVQERVEILHEDRQIGRIQTFGFEASRGESTRHCL